MKISTTTELVAKEGWKYLGAAALLFVLSLCFDILPWVFFVILIFTAYLFRNPERLPAEDDEMAILAPSDGTIIAIEKVAYNDEKEYIKVRIQKSLLDTCILRAPTKMSIKSTKRRHGLFLPSNSELSEKIGEQASLACDSKYDEVFIIINAGAFARKIELFKTVGPLKSAQRFGLLVEGNIELYLPLDSRVKVAIGDEVKAGESVLGYFAHKEDTNDR